jgi:spermidine synthase
LAEFADEGPLNTDDHPIVIFQAPRFAYRKKGPAFPRLLALVNQFKPSPQDILKISNTPDDHISAERLAVYWRARDKFLHTGVGIRQTANVKEMLQQVRDPLLDIVRESPDFDAAYGPLIAMAQRLYPIDPVAAEKLLIELEHASPHRREASQLREYLSR